MDITPFENNGSDEGCKEDLTDNEGDLELLENVFDEASNLNEKERSNLILYLGYVVTRRIWLFLYALQTCLHQNSQILCPGADYRYQNERRYIRFAESGRKTSKMSSRVD